MVSLCRGQRVMGAGGFRSSSVIGERGGYCHGKFGREKNARKDLERCGNGSRGGLLRKDYVAQVVQAVSQCELLSCKAVVCRHCNQERRHFGRGNVTGVRRNVWKRSR